MTDAFDSDVLIYAAIPDHEFRPRIIGLLADDSFRVGSLLLLPEVLGKPIRQGRHREVASLTALLGRLELLDLDGETAQSAVELSSTYGLRGADAVHLATAVIGGADRFITNNRKDFPSDRITEIDVVYPADLPELR